MHPITVSFLRLIVTFSMSLPVFSFTCSASWLLFLATRNVTSWFYFLMSSPEFAVTWSELPILRFNQLFTLALLRYSLLSLTVCLLLYCNPFLPRSFFLLFIDVFSPFIVIFCPHFMSFTFRRGSHYELSLPWLFFLFISIRCTTSHSFTVPIFTLVCFINCCTLFSQASITNFSSWSYFRCITSHAFTCSMKTLTGVHITTVTFYAYLILRSSFLGCSLETSSNTDQPDAAHTSFLCATFPG